MRQTHPMQLPGSPKPLKGKCGAKLIKSKKKYGGPGVVRPAPKGGFPMIESNCEQFKAA